MEKIFEYLTKATNGASAEDYVAKWAEYDASFKQLRAKQAVCNADIASAAWVAGARTYATKSLNDSARWFFDWLVNRSYAAKDIIVPDGVDRAEFAALHGIVLSGDLPANVLVGILIWQRQFREHPGVVAFAHSIVEKGYDEDFAALAAWSVSFCDDAYVNTNHYPIAPTELVYWRNFLDRNIVGKLHKPFVEDASYRRCYKTHEGGCTGLWGPSAQFNDADFYGKLKEAANVKKSSDGVVINNPFKRVVAGYAEQPSKADILALLPGLRDYFDQQAERKAA